MSTSLAGTSRPSRLAGYTGSWIGLRKTELRATTTTRGWTLGNATWSPTRSSYAGSRRAASRAGRCYGTSWRHPGWTSPVDALESTEDRNESLDAESVEFLRLLNIHRIENEGIDPVRIDNRPIMERLAPLSRGPKLTLPPAVLEAFSVRWEESNRAVAQEFFPDDGCELFAPRRDSLRGSVEQRLDPDRLPHFLALAELPDELYVPLRQVAEREARTG